MTYEKRSPRKMASFYAFEFYLITLVFFKKKSKFCAVFEVYETASIQAKIHIQQKDDTVQVICYTCRSANFPHNQPAIKFNSLIS